jgi:hypothetical protein
MAKKLHGAAFLKEIQELWAAVQNTENSNPGSSAIAGKLGNGPMGASKK